MHKSSARNITTMLMVNMQGVIVHYFECTSMVAYAEQS